MATSYPYTSAQGSLVKAVEQFRKNFPPTIDAAILQKFSIAPANESYVINTFRFLGLIDENLKTVDSVGKFFRAGDAEFQAGLDALLRDAYKDLYTEQGEEPWTVFRDDLTTWFRVTDKTSEVIGGRQAATYLTLAALAGHGEPVKASSGASPTKKVAGAAATKTSSTKKETPRDGQRNPPPPNNQANQQSGNVGLTVRVEVNLPADAKPETYDAIFASIRKNLMTP